MERIELLLARWEAAETTLREERALRELLRTAELPADLLWARQLFCGAEALAGEALPGRLAAWMPPVAADAAARPSALRIPLWRRRTAWGVAAAAVVAAVITFGAWQTRRPLCYIDGVAVYDRETALCATEYLGGLAKLETPSLLLDRLIETNIEE